MQVIEMRNMTDIMKSSAEAIFEVITEITTEEIEEKEYHHIVQERHLFQTPLDKSNEEGVGIKFTTRS